MADYGYLASEFFEVYANESTELGRVVSLMYEVNATESTEKGRIAALMYEVNAAEDQKVRVRTLFAEVFVAPKSGPAFLDHFTAADAVSDGESGGSGWRRWS